MASEWSIDEQSVEVVAKVSIHTTMWTATDDDDRARFVVTADVKGRPTPPNANPNGGAISKRSAYANWREKLRMAKGR
jgi:hypothetical protein